MSYLWKIKKLEIMDPNIEVDHIADILELGYVVIDFPLWLGLTFVLGHLCAL